MKDYMKVIGGAAVAAALAGAPLVALAEDNGGDSAQVEVQTTGATAPTEVQKMNREHAREVAQQIREQAKSRAEDMRASSTDGTDEASMNEDMEQEDMPDFRENENVSAARSFEDLKNKIEMRKHELEQELASSTEKEHGVVANANPVRLAVHTLLASKDLLGGIGSQVSEIAKHMNDSVASTTAAEEQIQSRGFLKRLFFGGDKAAANAIDNAVEQNQQHIDELTNALNQANVSAELKATLEAQIAALKDAQEHLQEVAQKEQRTWGIFSWRF